LKNVSLSGPFRRLSACRQRQKFLRSASSSTLSTADVLAFAFAFTRWLL